MSEHRMPRVLVVDDEERVRGLLCDLLAAWGCQAVEAANGVQALTLFEQNDYDLVLTDFLMPDRNGLEVIRSVREKDATIGVIMFTASAADLEADSRELDFTLLRKPLQLDGLKGAVSQALRHGARGMPAPLR